MYSLSKYIQARISFFNKNVLPHSLGPDIIHLKFSGSLTSVIILSSFSDDCRSLFMFTEILLLRSVKPLGLPQTESVRGYSLLLGLPL